MDVTKDLLDRKILSKTHPDGRDLVQQQLRGGGGGHAVKRHVHKRGDAARRRRPRGCGRAWRQGVSAHNVSPHSTGNETWQEQDRQHIS
jgi:hypothetical protein